MAKKPKGKPKKPNQVWKLYKTTGGKLERKNPSCPKCGPGIFMSAHKDRQSCGKCGFTEMRKQSA